MKKKPSSYTLIVSCAIAGLVLAGCAQQQQRGGAAMPVLVGSDADLFIILELA
jgi:hypothetical protein